MPKNYTLIVNVPVTHADNVRQAIGDAGGGKAGNYTHCSFSVRGTGRFKGNLQSHPAIGQPGHYETVEEDRIEVAHISEDVIADVIQAMITAHPYEETAYQLIELANQASQVPNITPDISTAAPSEPASAFDSLLKNVIDGDGEVKPDNI